MRKVEFIDRPPGPFFGFWSARYLDTWKFIKFGLSGKRKIRHENFKKTLQAGDPMPTVALKTTEGVEVNLSGFHGKRNIVLEFGAIT